MAGKAVVVFDGREGGSTHRRRARDVSARFLRRQGAAMVVRKRFSSYGEAAQLRKKAPLERG